MMRAIRLALLLAVLLAVVLVAACASHRDRDPASWRNFDRGVREMHDAWCADPRGTLPDGSCTR